MIAARNLASASRESFRLLMRSRARRRPATRSASSGSYNSPASMRSRSVMSFPVLEPISRALGLVGQSRRRTPFGPIGQQLPRLGRGDPFKHGDGADRAQVLTPWAGGRLDAGQECLDACDLLRARLVLERRAQRLFGGSAQLADTLRRRLASREARTVEPGDKLAPFVGIGQ